MRQKESIGELTFYDLESRFYHWYITNLKRKFSEIEQNFFT